jgi:hypothetical protein
VWLGIAVAATVVLIVLLVPSGSWVATDVRRSSLRTTPDGVAAWSRSLDRLGLHIQERFRSFTAAPISGSALVLLEPIQPPSAAEVGRALTWAREGGVIVYSPSYASLLLDSLGLSIERRSLAPGADAAPGPSRLRPHRWTSGIESDSLIFTWSLEPDSVSPPPWTPLAVVAGSEDVTLAWVPEGEGGVLVTSEAAPLSNGSLQSSAFAAVVTRALLDLLPAGDTVVFAEYHQGIEGRGLFSETFRMARSTPVGRVLLDLAAVAVVLLLLSGRSFGAPGPEPETDRRSPLEHVEALGHIYENAHADRAVARRLVLGAVRRSGQRPGGAETELEILEAWSGRPELASHTRLAMAALRREPPDLVRLSSALDAIVDEYAPENRTP